MKERNNGAIEYYLVILVYVLESSHIHHQADHEFFSVRTIFFFYILERGNPFMLHTNKHIIIYNVSTHVALKITTMFIKVH